MVIQRAISTQSVPRVAAWNPAMGPGGYAAAPGAPPHWPPGEASAGAPKAPGGGGGGGGASSTSSRRRPSERISDAPQRRHVVRVPISDHVQQFGQQALADMGRLSSAAGARTAGVINQGRSRDAATRAEAGETRVSWACPDLGRRSLRPRSGQAERRVNRYAEGGGGGAPPP